MSMGTFAYASNGNRFVGADTLAAQPFALAGIPFDGAVTNRPGARFGPRALRAIERIGPYNHVLDVAPVHALRVGDVGDVPFRSRYSLPLCIEDLEQWYRHVAAQGVLPLTVGGDHSITYPIMNFRMLMPF
jgi:agmatinase